MNNDQEIILAKISAVYDKPPFVKMETGQMEMILKCVGLGAYYDKYREYLEPYWYNGRFQNPVESYRIFVGLNSIFEDLLNERKGDEIISLLTELGNYIPGTILSDEARFAADFNKLRQLYNLMGLQIVSMEVDEYSSKFQVEPYLNEGNQIIQSFGMERWLKSKYQDVYEAYESALNSFSSGDLGAAIESCRTALTGIFSKYKGVPFQKAKWMLGMATLTGDFTGTQSADASEMTSIKNEIEAMGKRDIADFFEENLEGSYKKTKAIYSIYSMLSDYGTHRLEGTVEVAKNEDALMMIRMTTDILVWIYQKPLALCDRCPCFGSLFPPLAALTFAASSIICAFGLASAAPRSSYRHLELCGIAQTKCRNGTPCPAAADPNPSILRYYHRIRTRMAASMPLSCAVRPASTLPVTSSMV